MVCSTQGWTRGKMEGYPVFEYKPHNLDPKHYCTGKHSPRLGSDDFPLQNYSLSPLLKLFFTAFLCVHNASVHRLQGPQGCIHKSAPNNVSLFQNRLSTQAFPQRYNFGSQYCGAPVKKHKPMTM